MNISDLKKRLIAGDVEYVYQTLNKHFTNNIDDPLYYQFQTLESNYLNARKSGLTLTGQWQSKFLDILDDMDELDLDAHQASETSRPRKRKKRPVLIGMLCALLISISMVGWNKVNTNEREKMGILDDNSPSLCPIGVKDHLIKLRNIRNDLKEIPETEEVFVDDDELARVKEDIRGILMKGEIEPALEKLYNTTKERSKIKGITARLRTEYTRTRKDHCFHFLCTYNEFSRACNRITHVALEAIDKLTNKDIRK